MIKVDDFIDFLKSSKLVFAYFAIITVLMIYQHSMGWAWDFSVYSLNAQYLFHEQVYMEWKRPPFLPFLLGIIQFVVSMRAAEYVSIILISSLFLYSVYRFSDKYDLDFTILYVLIASPGVVFFATLEGTELLFLSFLILALSEFDRPRSGFWLALGFLTHYTGGLFLLLLAFQRDLQRILNSAILFGLTVSPWLIFNFLVLGHPLASIADSYALDVAERSLTTPFDPLDMIYITGLAIPFALYYVKERQFDLMDYMMIFLFVLIVLRQLSTDMKITRYMFDLALPAGYLATRGLMNISNKKILKLIMILYLIGSVFAVLTFSGSYIAHPAIYEDASDELGDCLSASDSWPYLSYAGTPTGPIETQFMPKEEYVEQGYRIVNFEYGEYSIEGSSCVETSFNSTYIERLNKANDARICDYAPINYCSVEDRVINLLN